MRSPYQKLPLLASIVLVLGFGAYYLTEYFSYMSIKRSIASATSLSTLPAYLQQPDYAPSLVTTPVSTPVSPVKYAPIVIPWGNGGYQAQEEIRETAGTE
eukprot:1637072-Pyramimonas_sp.AAC.2